MEDAVSLRGVSFLCHFTKFLNIESILTHGLLTRKRLNQSAINFEFNDSYRIDGYANSVCCSIMYPNYKMFYSLRQSNPEARWCVVGIDKSVLWEKPCLFCMSNAASKEVTSVSEHNKQGVPAFLSLFEDMQGCATRLEMGIPDCYTTNPQAEVLVLDDISTEYILGVSVDDLQLAKSLKQKFPEYKISYSSKYLKPRPDYEFWR